MKAYFGAVVLLGFLYISLPIEAKPLSSYHCFVRLTQTLVIVGEDGSYNTERREFRTKSFPIRKDVKLEPKAIRRPMFEYQEGFGAQVKFEVYTVTGTYLNSPQGNILQAFVRIKYTEPETKFGFVAPIDVRWADSRESLLAPPESGGGTYAIYCKKESKAGLPL